MTANILEKTFQKFLIISELCVCGGWWDRVRAVKLWAVKPKNNELKDAKALCRAED